MPLLYPQCFPCLDFCVFVDSACYLLDTQTVTVCVNESKIGSPKKKTATVQENTRSPNSENTGDKARAFGTEDNLATKESNRQTNYTGRLIGVTNEKKEGQRQEVEQKQDGRQELQTKTRNNLIKTPEHDLSGF